MPIVNLIQNPRYMHEPSPEFLKRVQDYADARNGMIYSPIPHPAFDRFKTAHGTDRWDLIKAHIPDSARTALDIGAHWGYWSHMLEQHGLDTTATESSEDALFFMREIRRLTDTKFDIIGGDVLDLENPDFDLVIGLNIFHHFLKKKRVLQKFITFLGRLKCETMIYQAHGPDEGQMRGAYMNLTGEEVCEFMISHSLLTGFEYVGAIKNRKVYKLWKDTRS